MTQASEPSTPRERDALGLLYRRARTMSLLHEALLGAGAYKDLYRIIVAGAVWPTAIDFSSAALFRLDPAANVFRGCGGFGATDRALHDAVMRNAASEQGYFDKMVVKGGANSLRAREEALFAHPGEPEHETFWEKLAIEFERGNTLLRDVRGLTIPAPIADEIETVPGQLMAGGGSFSVRLPKGDRGGLPREVRDLMPGETLWAIIRTKAGSILLLGADKRWADDPAFDDLDTLQLDWFAAQAAMALERIDVLSELRRSNENMKILEGMKSSFLSTISHELRTPLTGIMGFTKLLLGGQLGPMPENQREILTRVRASSEKLRDMINDLIELAEIDAGIDAEIQLEPVDPLALVIETLPQVEDRRKSRHAKVEPVVSDTVPMIRADRARLTRVLTHLLDNALKFSKDGGTVRVAFEALAGEVAIRVIDDGIGIEPERLERIWKAFYQADDKLQRVYPGMGIGLAVSHKLMKETGGRLDVKSIAGAGSTFSIIYPLATPGA